MCIYKTLQILPLRSDFNSIHSHVKRLYLHMLDIVDTPFGYERELIVCLFLQDFFKVKGSSLQVICNAHRAFLLCGAEMCACEKGNTCNTKIGNGK